MIIDVRNCVKSIDPDVRYCVKYINDLFSMLRLIYGFEYVATHEFKWYLEVKCYKGKYLK